MSDIGNQLSGAFHTAFRKASDHAIANEIWHKINKLPQDEWANIIGYVEWSTPALKDAAKGPPPAIVDKIVEAVRTDLLARSQLGIAKYGTTLERTDLTLRDWLQHTYEETLDQANYLKRAIMKIDQETGDFKHLETLAAAAPVVTGGMITINGRKMKWPQKRITFQQVINLAYKHVEHRSFTMTWRSPFGCGGMLPGENIAVVEGLVFNVVHTGLA